MQEEETKVLSSKNSGDVRELQRRLRNASLDFAKNLLELFESVKEAKQGSEDPEKIEKRRIELETIERGQYREGTGWIWNGHVVPAPTSTTEHYQRRERIIRNGDWNPTRRGWDYQGEFFGVWD